eukprot:764539-Hanusia_phi.AAC.5
MSTASGTLLHLDKATAKGTGAAGAQQEQRGRKEDGGGGPPVETEAYREIDRVKRSNAADTTDLAGRTEVRCRLAGSLPTCLPHDLRHVTRQQILSEYVPSKHLKYKPSLQEKVIHPNLLQEILKEQIGRNST